jgi:hypothetical protein
MKEINMKEKRVVVTIYDGLYYNLETEVFTNEPEPHWKREGIIKMVHENMLEDAIATIFRGPSIV